MKHMLYAQYTFPISLMVYEVIEQSEQMHQVCYAMYLA
jgi:hypothetical protein